jgi:elongator complex protein 3
MLDQLILTIINRKANSSQELEVLKKRFIKGRQTDLPKNYRLLKAYHRLVKSGRISPQKWLADLLLTKPVRTFSGVAPLAVILKPFPCPGKCFYCPDQGGVPKSYLADEPAVLRASQFGFDAFDQVKYRLRVFQLMGHQAEKVELIILGGTFSYYPRAYRQKFIKACFDAANRKETSNLAGAQKANEASRHRLIGITVETRPDLIDLKEIRFLRKLGVTRVEIGVQSLDPAILKKARRGHGIQEIIRATRKLRQAGFKICYHLMPGLPGSSFSKDVRMFKKVFADFRFQPDFLKVYPCVVLKEAPLYQQWRLGKFKPLNDQQLVKLLAVIKEFIPEYVRINRLGRDIPVGNIVAGYRYSHIRQLVKQELKKQKLTCGCIRCREVRRREFEKEKLELKIIDYRVSGGWECFLEFVDRQNRLYALLRLFLPNQKVQPIFPVLKKAALIRELHTFGQSLGVGKKRVKASQHQGLGKQLLDQAEKIAKQKGFAKIAIIAGVGVREYYRNLSYQLKQTYMVKNI